MVFTGVPQRVTDARQEAGEVNFRHVDHDRRVQHIVADRIYFPNRPELGFFHEIT